jgi:hypothetical protein
MFAKLSCAVSSLLFDCKQNVDETLSFNTHSLYVARSYKTVRIKITRPTATQVLRILPQVKDMRPEL